MKKQYIIPTVDVIKIKPFLFMAGSDPKGDGAIDPDAQEENAGGVASRFFSFDDDDEEY